MTHDANFWRAPEGVRRHYIDGRFGQLHYRVARPDNPSNTPLLCIHSSPSSSRIYAALLGLMGRDRIAIAPDTPGFGESDAPAAPPEIADYAAQMGELIEALELGTVDLVGYHTGCKIAVELALQSPELVRRLALVSAPIYSEAELESQKENFGRRENKVNGEDLQRRWNWMLQYRMPDVPVSLMQRNFSETLRGGETSWWGHRAAFNYAHADHLPKVTHPILVLNPDDDLVEQTKRATDYLKNGEIKSLPGWSHGFTDVHTAELAEILRDYFDSPAHDVTPSEISPQSKAPPRPPTTSRPFERRFIDGPYGQIHLRIAEPERATARPLVCIHMSPSSGRVFEAFLAEMGKDRIAIAADSPGFGESEAPPEMPSIELFASFTEHVIASLCLGDEVDVIGYHTGSMTAVELARTRPDLVRHVIMISAPLYTEAERADRITRYKPEEWPDDGSHLAKRWNFMKTFYGPQVPYSILARNFAESSRGGPISWWGHRAAFEYPMAETLPEVKQPVLVLNPDDDLAEQTPRAAEYLTNGRVQHLAGWTHGFLDIHTEALGALVREFFASG